MTKNSMKCLLISDFNVKSLTGHLENSNASPRCEVKEAPFDQVTQTILDENNECWAERSECVVVWTRPERVSPSFARVLAGESVPEEHILGEVETFCDLVSKIEGRASHCFLPGWVLTQPRRGLGLIDLKPGQGVSYLLMKMNLALAQRFSSSRAFFVLDSNRWLLEVGKWAYSPKSWYLAKVPFGNELLAHAASEVKAALRALAGQTKKLVVLDLDDTLWGGIVGDVGWENLVLGGHDAFGEAFVDFQRELRSLRSRGFLLAIASKNEESRALEAIGKHPEMVLKKEDFAAWRINWNDKAGNIADLVLELNLGLDSVVFLDDNPVERQRVSEAMPAVLVPELPQDILQRASFLRKLDCFDQVFISDTDKERTQLYQSAKEREALRLGAQSIDEWLDRLGTRLSIEPLNSVNWDRALQLLNKTNQMNLSTRRLSDAEFKAWVGGAGNRFWTVRVADRFGDSGIVGLMSLKIHGNCGRVIDFILSCRVMGRKVEEEMLRQLLLRAVEFGAEKVEAEFIPTAKNAPCLKFFERVSGARTGNLFTLEINDLSNHAIKSIAVEAQVA